jgi:transcription elongation factor Elf1
MSESHPPPIAGQDYPKTWSQFMDWFHSEQACLDYLQRLRWPKEFICPSCGVVGIPIKTSRNRLICQSCKHQASVTAGTIFDKTRTPLKEWLAAA